MVYQLDTFFYSKCFLCHPKFIQEKYKLKNPKNTAWHFPAAQRVHQHFGTLCSDLKRFGFKHKNATQKHSRPLARPHCFSAAGQPMAQQLPSSCPASARRATGNECSSVTGPQPSLRAALSNAELGTGKSLGFLRI